MLPVFEDYCPTNVFVSVSVVSSRAEVSLVHAVSSVSDVKCFDGLLPRLCFRPCLFVGLLFGWFVNRITQKLLN